MATLATVVLLAATLYAAVPARAHEGSWINSAYTISPPTTDGNLSVGEWATAAVVDLAAVSGNVIAGDLLVANNDTMLYIAYDMVGDATADRADSASVSFDTGHDAAMSAGHEDQFFWGGVAQNGSEHYVSNGPGWRLQDSPFNTSLPNEANLAAAVGFGPSDLSATPHRVYEIQIPLALLNAAPGEVLGLLGGSQAFPGVLDGTGLHFDTWPTFLFGPPPLDKYGDLRLGKAQQTYDVDLDPPSQSANARPSSSVFYNVTVVNRGTGPDTFEITNTSAWPVTVFDASMSPLPDTDGDSTPDTGTLAAGANVTIIARVDVPNVLGCSDARIVGTSGASPPVSDFAILHTCIPPASFSPPHSDHGVDTDVPPNGLFNSLEVDVGVFVSAPGPYAVQAALFDGTQSAYIASGFTPTFLPLGRSVVPVSVPGVPIWQSGFDGPYAAVLLLIDGSGNLLEQTTYFTGPYLSTDFDPPGALFNPPHSDRGIDRDVPPNGLFDVLAVNASLNVNRAGTYMVNGILFDPGGNFITTVSATATVATGPQVIELDFPGRDIFTRGLDGPYRANMDLFDDVGNLLDFGFHITGPYQSTDFDPPGARFAPPHANRGVDLTVPPDGLFEYLEVNASVQVSKAGPYRVNAALFDPTFSFIIATTSVSLNLAVGAQTVPLWFDGLQLRMAGFDGPYVADLVLFDSVGFLDENIYFTAPYAVSDFAPPGAAFAPPHTDSLDDTDGDGLADFLLVYPNLTVAVAGTYTVTSLLQDSTGAFLGTAMGCGYALPVGNQFCTLTFDGHAIADFGSNGPYTVVMRLTDAYGRLLGSNLYTTPAYAATDFEPSDRTAPTAVAGPVPYWINQGPLDVPFTATDPSPTDGLAYVTLSYRHGTDNATWGPWTGAIMVGVSGRYENGTAPFSFPDGVGFYEFQYTAEDLSGNLESLGPAESRAFYRPATSLAFVPNPLTLTAGQPQTVQVRVLGPDGQPTILQAPLTVSLSTNSATGEFRAVGTGAVVTSVTIPGGQTTASVDYYDVTAGTWMVRASSGPTTDGTAQATVNAQLAATVAITPSSAAVRAGGTQPFTAEAFDPFGNAVTATFAWAADAAIGSINAGGVLTAATRVASGNVTVLVVGAPSVTATASVVLIPGPAASVAVSPGIVSVAAGGSQSFTGSAFDAFGNAVTATFTWSASAAIGAISPAGVLTAATTLGSGTVTATVVGAPTVSGTSSVTIVPGPAATVSVSPTPVTLAVDAARTFTATVRDAFGNTVANALITWSATGGIGTVDSSGAFTAGHLASAGTVRASSGSAQGAADVTVTPGPVTRIVVAPPSKILAVGTTQAFTADVTDQYGNVVPGQAITWTVTGSIGTIDAFGTLTAAFAPSTGKIVATVGTAVGEAVVSLVPGPAAAVQISPSAATVQYGTTIALRAVVVDQYGNTIPGATIDWTVSGPGTLSASSGAATTLTTNVGGSVTVTATSGSHTGIAQFTVVGPPDSSSAPLFAAGGLIAGLVAGLAVGWVVRGRRGKGKKDEESQGTGPEEET
ncbi:MAG: hypothetical protein E6K18_04095 [Methanobacteriota archaeon]|nr:MAG: hypothetical protein E6K18_04095 [Euryarchaeota archaeon]